MTENKNTKEYIAELEAKIDSLVGKMETSKPLEEKEYLEEPNPEVQGAAVEVIKLAQTGESTDTAAVRALTANLYDAGDYEQAIELAQLIVKADNADAVDYYNLGFLLSHTKRQEDEEKAYRKAIALDPNLTAAWNGLGILLSDSDRKEEAEKAFRKAIEIDPNYAQAWFDLGFLLIETDRRDEAEEAYRKAIELDPNYVSAWRNLGLLLSDTDRKDESEKAYRKVIELDPDDAGSRNNLAYLLWNLQRFEEAEAEITEAIRLDPDDAYSNATLGLLKFEQGDIDGGRNGYERAMELDPDDRKLKQKFYYEYGRALARKGQKEKARYQLERALKTNAGYVPQEEIETELLKL